MPRVTPHDLRHTAASLAISAGANVKAVQRMLGHASAAMTLDTYADLFDDDLDLVAAALSRALRTFLAVSTGARVQYMHIKDLTANSELVSVAPVFAALDDAQFSPGRGDIEQLVHATTEVVHQWS